MLLTALKLSILIAITCYFNKLYYEKKIELKEKQVLCKKISKYEGNL